MKRSEMLKLMRDFINTVECDYDIYIGDYPEEIDNLLTKMELAGMLPPTTTLNKLGVTDNAWDSEE